MCPHGYVSITTFDECKTASIEVGISGWNGEKFNDHPARMPYCWIGSGGNSNFNVNGDHSDNYGSCRLICKKDTRTTETPTTRGMNSRFNFIFSFLTILFQ